MSVITQRVENLYYIIHLSRSRDSRKTYGRRVKKKEGSQEPPPGRCARDIIRERGHTDPESQQAARCGTQRHFLRPQIPFPSVGKRHKACRPSFVSTRAPLSIAIEEGRKERNGREVINASQNNRDNRLRINRFEIMIVEKIHREFKCCECLKFKGLLSDLNFAYLSHKTNI